jgi:hypothetical protein
MTDYAALTDAELNAAVAVRVCGYREEKEGRWGKAMIDPKGIQVGNWEKARGWVWFGYSAHFMPNWCGCLNACFAAQQSLAAKGEEILFAYVQEMVKLKRDATYPWLLMADARTRCVAMLQACDAVEKANG